MKDNPIKDRKKALKQMKKDHKKQKKTMKKERKKQIALAKEDRKLQREEIKLQRQGYQPPPATPAIVEVEPEGTTPDETDSDSSTWSMKSPAVMPVIEKRIDIIADRRRGEDSNVNRMYREKYGIELDVPRSHQIPMLSEEEKRLLEEDRAREQPEVVEQEATAEVKTGKRFKFGLPSPKIPKMPKKLGSPKQATPRGFLYPWQLYLFNRFGKGKHIIIKLIVGIISAVGWIPISFIRIPIWILRTIIGKIRGRGERSATDV